MCNFCKGCQIDCESNTQSQLEPSISLPCLNRNSRTNQLKEKYISRLDGRRFENLLGVEYYSYVLHSEINNRH